MSTKIEPSEIDPAKRWDFFFRTETGRRSWAEQMERNPYVVSAAFEPGTKIEDALEFCYRERLIARGSARSGVFEVQTPEGIYRQVNESRMDFSTARRAKNVVFKTWAELDAED